jgi:mono/diheme cytochrome c family protein
MAERWLGEPDSAVFAAVLERLEDAEPAVRRQLAASLGTPPTGTPTARVQSLRHAAIVTLLERYADDPITVDAALSGLRGGEAAALEALLERDGEQTPPKDTAITMLAATIVRGAQDAAVQALLASIADENRALWQRSAILRGAEVALLGAVIPGTRTARANPPRAAAGLPCPTCPGGRSGPGGAYALRRPEDAEAIAGGSGTNAGRGAGIRLSREPAPLSALASQGGELGSRVTNLLARMTWPGKPGEGEPVPRLTVAEQALFDAGREIYKNICQACHQADGRGQDRVAPSLVGSALALAAPEIPVRILLNGKEGPVGLMPPAGSVLSDEQVASVLTYIRREWGQSGTPVDSGAVKAVRAITAGRARPWTDGELKALATGGRGQPR